MNIIMLGAPGTGKGTVASILAEKLGIPQVSTGDIFRENIKNGTKLGKIASKYMNEGKLVPDDITIGIIDDKLTDDDVKGGIILDGFPRTVFQAEELEKILEKQNRQVDMVINLITPEEEIIERVVNRRVCSNQDCKTVYNIVLNPPKIEDICDKCGNKLVKRADDNPETIKNRIKTYLDSTAPLIEYYENKGKLVTETVSKDVKLGKEVAEELVERIKGE